MDGTAFLLLIFYKNNFSGMKDRPTKSSDNL